MSRTVVIERPDGAVQATLQATDFKIDPSSIDSQLCNLATLILSYGEIETELRVEAERKHAGVDKLEADLDEAYRLEMSKIGAKTTEAKVKNAVLGNPIRLQALESLSQSRRNHNMLKWAMKALDAKRDCLLALAYRERQLMKADHY